MLDIPIISRDAVPGPVLRSMFEARKRVFVDLLKWDLPVLEDRFELDQFDTPDASYIVLTDERGSHRASARLLRSDGPHLLGDLFPDLCSDAVPAGPAIREITRFCIEPSLPRTERRTVRNQLVSALVDHALKAGIERFTAVATPGWFRQIERFGWNCRALGPRRDICGESLVAAEISIDRHTCCNLRAAGIYTAGVRVVTGSFGDRP